MRTSYNKGMYCISQVKVAQAIVPGSVPWKNIISVRSIGSIYYQVRLTYSKEETIDILLEDVDTLKLDLSLFVVDTLTEIKVVMRTRPMICLCLSTT